MNRYSIAVALFDFLPVLLSALALALLARGIARRRPALAPIAWTAAALVPFGGACKASWKLSIAVSGADLAWLNHLLFIALAPGFCLMTLALIQSLGAGRGGAADDRHAGRAALLAALAPLAVAAALAAALPQSRAWFFWLLGVTTVASLALGLRAMRAAQGLGLAVRASFAWNLLATLALGGLSRLPPTEASAWVQESTNLSAQAALAYGCWHLGRHLRETP